MKVFGKNPCLEILKTDANVQEIFMFEKIEENFKQEILKYAKNAKIKYCNKDLLNKMSDFKNHQGIIIFCENYKYYNLDDILKGNENNSNLFLLILDNIEDPQNLGSLIRTSECAKIDAVILPKNHACKINETVFKVSAGAISHVKICEVTNINETIKKLKKENIFVFGLEAEGNSIYSTNLTGRTALVVGSEGKGISSLTKKNCDELISIPLLGKINSLNASIAGAIGIFEVIRQRYGKW